MSHNESLSDSKRELFWFLEFDLERESYFCLNSVLSFPVTVTSGFCDKTVLISFWSFDLHRQQQQIMKLIVIALLLAIKYQSWLINKHVIWYPKQIVNANIEINIIIPIPSFWISSIASDNVSYIQGLHLLYTVR